LNSVDAPSLKERIIPGCATKTGLWKNPSSWAVAALVPPNIKAAAATTVPNIRFMISSPKN
jgi:hypothetical protein